MTNHHEDIDKVLRDAIGRMGNKDPGAGLSAEVGEAIGQVAGETPKGTEDAEDIKDATDIERIKGNHSGGPGACRGVGPDDLQRVRDINGRNRARKERGDLEGAIPQPQNQDGAPIRRKKPLRL